MIKEKKVPLAKAHNANLTTRTHTLSLNTVFYWENVRVVIYRIQTLRLAVRRSHDFDVHLHV